MPLMVRNPHSVLAAVKTRAQDVLEIALPDRMAPNDVWGQAASLAQEKGVRRTKARPPISPNHGGGRESAAHALIKESTGVPVEELFSNARKRAQGKGLWLALDGLQDPHNVGAIFRTAAFFGIQGVLLTQERSASLTSIVYDVASGGIEYTPFTLQTNLQRAFEIAKDQGLWILGATEHAHDSVQSIQPDRPWLLVLGNEEKGMRRLTEESCDLLCKIPSIGKVGSLNVSVAAGILMSWLSH